MKILALGNTNAYSFGAFQEVEKAIRDRGHEIILFKQDKCLEGEYLSFSIENGVLKYTVVIDGKTYDVNEFSSIFYMNPLLPKQLLIYEPAEHRQLIHRQFRAMREGLWLIFQGSQWINDPVAIEIAENKLFQFRVASNFFLLPDTLFTSDPEAVRAFYRSHARAIVTKLIVASPIQDHVIYTNALTEEDMQQIESVKAAPAIFQALVEKEYELRITVVGSKIFPAKILSQRDAETSIDWRKRPTGTDFKVEIEPTEIPDEIKENILCLMRCLNLRYGCIDMAVTPTGKYVFFEINPAGQWYFVQLKTGMKIAEAIADLLLQTRDGGA